MYKGIALPCLDVKKMYAVHQYIEPNYKNYETIMSFVLAGLFVVVLDEFRIGS